MRTHLTVLASLLSFTAALQLASAAEIWVSPDGTATTDCTRDTPCDLATGASTAEAGDTVVLMDGVYDTSLYVANSGTSAAWITFEADECATPIIEGEGAGPNDDVESTGVGSAEAEYVRFRGIVSRGWNIGFGNGWAGGVDSDEVSNGHWEIENCISYSNGRTGFTFFSAEGFTLKNSISAHNGSSVAHSWSSGVTLFEATGTNLVEGNISFENTDAQQNTDGSGFIVDEESNGATFINNIAFGNAGSCLRLTDSSGTTFINNTCYHNSQFGSTATGPSNPGELYFTNGGVTLQGVSFTNNVIVGTGQAPAGREPVVNQPRSGWSNNVVDTGSVSYFADPDGTNPSFVPVGGDRTLTGQGTTGGGVPTTDLGFDPMCIVKRTPVMVGQVARESWWQYDIDIEYIQSIGGVAQCFNPKSRSGTPDIGAYAAGSVSISSGCTPTVGTGGAGTAGAPPTGGVGGEQGGTAGTPISSGGTAGGGEATGGAPPTGGMSGAGGTAGGRRATGGEAAGGESATGGVTASGGDTAAGGTTATGGDTAAGGTTATASGGTTAAGGTTASSGGSTNAGTGGAEQTCSAGLTLCGGVCVDLTADAGNCGQCGVVCSAGQVCSAGACTLTCASGLTQCGQACVDLNTHVLNCGGCGIACLAGQVCVGGQCTGTATGADVSVPAPIGAGAAGPAASGPIAAGDATSSADQAAAGTTGEATGSPTTSDSGCGCVTPARRPTRLDAALSMLLGLVLLGRRRRRPC